jgi:hypothetical protein
MKRVSVECSFLLLLRRSSWLLLNNLNQSIDSSTLKTLCSQHGQLTSFQLMMHQGMALICYKTYEEAAKAQSSLNNCVLGSTSIRADFVSEADVQAFMGGPGQGGGGGQMQGPPPQTSWSNATTSQASTMSRVRFLDSYFLKMPFPPPLCSVSYPGAESFSKETFFRCSITKCEARSQQRSLHFSSRQLNFFLGFKTI